MKMVSGYNEIITLTIRICLKQWFVVDFHRMEIQKYFFFNFLIFLSSTVGGN